jgi:hypothetical protein
LIVARQFSLLRPFDVVLAMPARGGLAELLVPELLDFSTPNSAWSHFFRSRF